MAIGTTSEFDKYTSVSGNAPGMPTKATTPRLPAGIAGRQGMNSISKYKVQNLAYPLNVERTPNNPITDGNGHYIIFEIMKQDPAKLRINRAAKGLANVISNTAKQHALATKEQKGRGPFSQNVPSKASMTAQAVSKYAISGIDAKGAVDAYRKGGSVKGSGTGSIQLQNAATTKMKVAIALYMPPSVKVNTTELISSFHGCASAQFTLL